VRHAGEHHGMNVRVDNVQNPRVEAEEHYYNPIHTKLPALGLKPTLLSENLIESTLVVIERFKDRVIPDVIAPSTAWRPTAAVGQPAR
jgi:UDP-sulfoquinovose synthase